MILRVSGCRRPHCLDRQPAHGALGGVWTYLFAEPVAQAAGRAFLWSGTGMGMPLPTRCNLILPPFRKHTYRVDFPSEFPHAATHELVADARVAVRCGRIHADVQ